MINRAISLLMIVQFCLTSNLVSQSNKLHKVIPDSTTQFKRLNINNISSVFSNDGLADYYKYNEPIIRFKYPNEKMLGFTNSGLIVGGKIDGEIKVSGTFYHSAMQPSGDKKIYRVRRDYKTGDLSREIIDGEGTETEIRNMYEMNWNDWPAKAGAPYEDKNKNGVYEPELDIPGYPGADQTIWFKASDDDTVLVKRWFGSNPLGIEVEYTYWAYKGEAPLGNTIFRKFRIKNTGIKEISEMYCAIQSDFDIGDPGDDLVGCDTSLALAYIYNRQAYDYFFNNTPPAIGFIFLNGRDNQNNKILLSSFNPFINLSPPFEFPASNSFEYGGLFWYNLFQGKTRDGNYYIIPDQYGGGNTKVPFTGDPITQTGWVDGIPYWWNNRGMNISVGPFNLQKGKSAELVFSLISSGGYGSVNRLDAVDSLRAYTKFVRDFYSKIDTVTTNVGTKNDGVLPDGYILFQNYPNPFNPTTTIRYQIPQDEFISLKVYDLLGREVAELVNENKKAGEYMAIFDGSKLSSGVYIYKLIGSNVNISKKMILMK